MTPKTCFRHGVSKHVDQNLPHISGFISEEHIKSLSYYLFSSHPPDYVGKLVTQAFLQMTFQTEDPRTGVRNCQLPRTSPVDYNPNLMSRPERKLSGLTKIDEFDKKHQLTKNGQVCAKSHGGGEREPQARQELFVSDGKKALN